MATKYNPRIVTSGLMMYVDAANPRSYPGTGNTWYDLSGNNNHMTLVNGVGFTTVNGGVLTTDGTNDYIELVNFDQRFTNHTIISAARYSGATRNRIITSRSNNWLLGHWYNYVQQYHAEGQIRLYGINGNTNWYISAAVENYSGDLWSLYTNGNPDIINSNAGSQGPYGLSFGAQGESGIGGERSTAEISFFMFYNRLLSAAEIQQNYNATKGRFGI
jgi:hypothetical protein